MEYETYLKFMELRQSQMKELFPLMKQSQMEAKIF